MTADLPARRRRAGIAARAGVLLAGVVLAGCGGGHASKTSASEAPEVSFQHVPGPPFGVVATPDGRYAFVDLVGGSVLVYSTSGAVPHMVRTIHVPGEAVGSSLTRDGRLLLVAGGQGASVVSVARAEDGADHPVLGKLAPPPSAHLRANDAIETASSANGHYVFVSLEYGSPKGAIAVYKVGSTSKPHFGSADYIGSIPLGVAVVGSALSTNGRYLYATSELGAQPRAQTGGVKNQGPEGTLSVVSVARAERDPAHAVLHTVPALYQPVRVAVSPNGAVVWVTARASNRLLAFSASKLLRDPVKALMATVKVGTAPVGVALFDNGDRVITANSNRFGARGAHASLTVVSAPAALAHRSAVVATVRSGFFPRELAVERGGKVVLVGNFASDQLESVNVSQLR